MGLWFIGKNLWGPELVGPLICAASIWYSCLFLKKICCIAVSVICCSRIMLTVYMLCHTCKKHEIRSTPRYLTCMCNV